MAAGADTDFDVIVIGLGPGGEAAADQLAKAGRAVLGVDERLVGGECPYYGCIPSKMILRGAETLAEGRRVAAMAGSAQVTPDWTPVATRIRDEATTDWDDQIAVDRLTDAGASFRRGRGALAGRTGEGRWQVRVGGESFTAKDVVLATGTSPSLPPINGLAELRGAEYDPAGRIWTNREVLRATELPATLAVLGGGRDRLRARPGAGPVRCDGDDHRGQRSSAARRGARVRRGDRRRAHRGRCAGRDRREGHCRGCGRRRCPDHARRSGAGRRRQVARDRGPHPELRRARTGHRGAGSVRAQPRHRRPHGGAVRR